MKVVGIIAEYNPFHNGHYYQIEYARTVLKADAVIVVMSGNFVQRGEPALLDKYTRAKSAIINGVDLIIELPVIAATGSAELFAECGINLLLSTGIVSDVIFGCEDESEELFTRVADLLNNESKEFKDVLDSELKKGNSYASARANAIQSVWENKEELPILSHFLSSPNNILGIEYTKAILKSSKRIGIHPLGRVGTSHDDLKFNGTYASATYIRHILRNAGASENDVFTFVPTNEIDIFKQALASNTIISPNDISLILHHKLLEGCNLSEVVDCNVEIQNRIENLLDEYDTYTNFCDLVKTKNINHSRVRRVLTHIYLNIKETQLRALKAENCAPYLHILGFSLKGGALLGQIKKASTLCLFTSPKEVKESLNDHQSIVLKSDLFASDIYRSLMTAKTSKTYPTEYTRKFTP